MRIYALVYQALLGSFSAVPPEAGAILGMRNGVITHFAYDIGKTVSYMSTYTPNVVRLNRIIQQWGQDGIQFCGFAHSHPSNQDTLSSGDVTYILRIFDKMPDNVKYLYFPLVFPGDNLVSYAAVRRDNRVDIIPDDIIIL